MQMCPTCSYESPLGAKFCRQCGGLLNAETEAATRNYGRQGVGAAGVAVAAPALSAPLPPSIADTFHSTARQAVAPAAAWAPATLTPSTPTTAKLAAQRPWMKVAKFAGVLLLGTIIGSVITKNELRQRPQLTPVEMALADAERAKADAAEALLDRQRSLNESLGEQREAAQEAANLWREQMQLAREQAQAAANQGPIALPTNGLKPLDFSGYEYTGAATANYSRIPGQELLVQRVQGDFAAIVQFYTTKFGKPLVKQAAEDEKYAIFQGDGTGVTAQPGNKLPSISALIEAADEPGQWQITITRSPFAFPAPEPPVDAPAPAQAPAAPASKPARAQ